MKFKSIILIVLALLFSIIYDYEVDIFLMNTIYTISGIMFSIGIGLIVTFNLQGIKNKSYILSIRSNLNIVRNNYIKFFVLSTISFILENYLGKIDSKKNSENIGLHIINIGGNIKFSINFSMFLFLLILFSILYFIINFLELQKLNNDIFDKTSE